MALGLAALLLGWALATSGAFPLACVEDVPASIGKASCGAACLPAGDISLLQLQNRALLGEKWLSGGVKKLADAVKKHLGLLGGEEPAAATEREASAGGEPAAATETEKGQQASDEAPKSKWPEEPFPGQTGPEAAFPFPWPKTDDTDKTPPKLPTLAPWSTFHSPGWPLADKLPLTFPLPITNGEVLKVTFVGNTCDGGGCSAARVVPATILDCCKDNASVIFTFDDSGKTSILKIPRTTLDAEGYIAEERLAVAMKAIGVTSPSVRRIPLSFYGTDHKKYFTKAVVKTLLSGFTLESACMEGGPQGKRNIGATIQPALKCAYSKLAADLKSSSPHGYFTNLTSRSWLWGTDDVNRNDPESYKLWLVDGTVVMPDSDQFLERMMMANQTDSGQYLGTGPESVWYTDYWWRNQGPAYHCNETFWPELEWPEKLDDAVAWSSFCSNGTNGTNGTNATAS